jgi:Flp pilus assembly protein TadD
LFYFSLANNFDIIYFAEVRATAMPLHGMHFVFAALLACSFAATQTDDPEQLIAEGVRFIQENDLTEAEDRFRKALAADPNNADPTNNLGVILRRQKSFQEAVTVFEAALRLRRRVADLLPGDTAAHYNVGRVLRKTGQLHEAAVLS